MNRPDGTQSREKKKNNQAKIQNKTTNFLELSILS